MAVIAVESAFKYSFVLKGMQTRQKGQHNAELTLLPRLCVRLLITAITAILNSTWMRVSKGQETLDGGSGQFN